MTWFVVVVATLVVAAPVSIPLDVRLRAGFRVPAPIGHEAALIDDAKDGKLNTTDLATAALIASGVPDVGLNDARSDLFKATSTARNQALTQKSAARRGDRLLRALHDTVFRRYVEMQSDVAAIARSGEFNCLSSAVLFLIAAEGLVDRPRGMLSKTHAFARVDVDGKISDIETTTPDGFGVDRGKLVTLSYLKTLGVGDGLTDAERLADLRNPEEVPLTGLIAALYSNRGVMLMHAGDVEGAAVAFDRATRIAQGEQRTMVAQWRSALLNNATQRLMDEGRLDDAKALLALALDGSAGATRAALLQNLANVAVAQAVLARKQGRLREARLLLDEALATGTTSTMMLAQIGTAVADLDGQLAALTGDESRCAALTTVSQQQRCFVSASQQLAKKEQVPAALSAARAARALNDGIGAGLKDPNVASVLFNALVLSIRHADKARECERVEAFSRDVVATAREIPSAPAFPAAHIMGQCWWGRASSALEAERFDEAASLFTRARVHLPNDKALANNLRAVNLRQAHELAKAGRCDEARPLATRDDDDDGRGKQMLALCANERAIAKANARDWAAAVAELRRGLIDAPASTILDDNLRRMLHNLTLDHLRARRCDSALALVPELSRRKQSEIIDDVNRVCRH